MSDSEEKDLINLKRKKEDKTTDESETMTSDDDENPDGVYSSDDKFKVFIHPRLLDKMDANNYDTIRVIRGRGGRIMIKLE